MAIGMSEYSIMIWAKEALYLMHLLFSIEIPPPHDSSHIPQHVKGYRY